MKQSGKLELFHVYWKGQKEPVEVMAETATTRMADGTLILKISTEVIAEFPGKEVQGYQKKGAPPTKQPL
jgi:hypothetical protein